MGVSPPMSDGKVDKWSPLRIPDAFRQHSSKTEGSDDPMNSWDPSDWDDPDSNSRLERIKPNHMGQWLIVGAGFMVLIGVILFLGQFFPLTSRNPWTLVAVFWPASLMVVHVRAREAGFNAAKKLEWAFITTGRSVRVIPGRLKGRFGEGDIQHFKYNPLKSRSYGAYRFNFLKLADLEANREDLMAKAKDTNRGPDSDAHMLLPGPLTGENSESVLGKVYGVHGGSIKYHDSGSETDMRVTNPSTLDDDIAGDVLNHLELYDQRIIPQLYSELETVESQRDRFKQRAEAEQDPQLDRIFGAIDRMSSMFDGRKRSTEDSEETESQEIAKQAREELNQ